ncbi:sarcosine oxidase subunit gamma [Shimia haliotis]|uniref:Sarcosine oxidase subunit gamma n=1 Tax=Shimia haliotis TaxID=1280847 RepID=A0A1I4AA59_9RHOB|nr:sarcosine oxidase subunit gamma [Shimia haliotis]SFK52977.1 sarcosine oxidase subunit gamma [Shimia haliotis]
MAELSAKTPCAGLLPVSAGGVTLSEVDAGVLTSLSPRRGRAEALGKALDASVGAKLPEVNRATGEAGSRVIWFGQGQYLLMGPDPAAALGAEAAVTDQSDAWAVVRLDGVAAEDVLARLVPLDLRAQSFAVGHTARSMLGHMSVSITRTDPDTFQIMAFRSMAKTLVHEIETAMKGVAARGAG